MESIARNLDNDVKVHIHEESVYIKNGKIQYEDDRRYQLMKKLKEHPDETCTTLELRDSIAFGILFKFSSLHQFESWLQNHKYTILENGELIQIKNKFEFKNGIWIKI